MFRRPNRAPDGRFVVYSGPDVGTKFSAKAVTAEGATHPLPGMVLTRGARRLVFLPEGASAQHDGHGRHLVFLRGEIPHKDLWLIDLETGAEQPWIDLPADFDIRDFDITSKSATLCDDNVIQAKTSLPKGRTARSLTPSGQFGALYPWRGPAARNAGADLSDESRFGFGTVMEQVREEGLVSY